MPRSGCLYRHRAELILLLLIGAIWFSVIQVRTLTEPDEGRYAEIPREMLEGRDWVMPHLNGMQYLEKPPLQYWATAAGYRIFGVAPWVSRLWSAGLGFLGLVLIYAIGRILHGTEAARFAALLLASLPLYVCVAQINVLDMGLAFFLTAALGCLLAAQLPTRGSSQRSAWMWACWVSLALAFLQKGLVAFVLPGFAVAAYSIVERDAALWRRLNWGSGLLIIAAIDLPWLVSVTARNAEFPEFFFVHEHFARFASTIHGRAQPWWYFPVVLTVGMFPWLPVIGAGVISSWRADSSLSSFRPGRFLAIWAAVILAFFSLSGSKLAPYIVPMMAPLALLGGRTLAARKPRLSTSALIAFPLLLGIACLMAPLIICASVIPGQRQTTYLQFSHWAVLAGGLIMATTLIAVAIARISRTAVPLRVVVPVISLGLCVALVIITAGTNALEPSQGGPSIGETMRPYLHPRTPFYCVGFYPQTVTFTLGRTCIVVQYKGELMPQFDDGERNWIASIGEFASLWNQQPNAVAIVDPALESRLVLAGLSMQIIARTPSALAIRRR